MRRMMLLFIIVLVVVSLSVGCAKKPSDTASTDNAATSGPPAGTSAANAPAAKKSSGMLAVEKTQPKIVPVGQHIVVRLGQAVGSKVSTSGQAFSATVAQPVEVNGTVLIPSGAEASGTVVEAVPLGRFKGGARLRLALDTVKIGGNTYKVETEAVTESAKGKGKRTAVAIGGGTGLGAVIGGLAGGGKGAAIGAIAGAGAGTAGAAFTGNKNIVLPSETALSFKLVQPLEVK